MRRKDLWILLLVAAVAFLPTTARADDSDATDPKPVATEEESTEAAAAEATAAQTPAPDYAEQPTPEDRNQGAASIGGLAGSVDGSQNRIGEFNVFDGDPLETITHCTAVVIDGKVISEETR